MVCIGFFVMRGFENREEAEEEEGWCVNRENTRAKERNVHGTRARFSFLFCFFGCTFWSKSEPHTRNVRVVVLVLKSVFFSSFWFVKTSPTVFFCHLDGQISMDRPVLLPPVSFPLLSPFPLIKSVNQSVSPSVRQSVFILHPPQYY